MEKERFKARDVQPTVVRLHPEVRAALERSAFVNGRSLSKEINNRLDASLKADAPAAGLSNYSAAPMATVVHTNEKGPAGILSGTDQAILEVFRRLPPEKQLALLSLLK